MKYDITDLLDTIRTAARKTQFAGFEYTAKGSGERANHTIILGASFTEQYRKDVERLETIIPELERLYGLGVTESPEFPGFSVELLRAAAHAVHSSRVVSLTDGLGNNPAYTNANTYEQTDIPGVKVHKATGEFHLMGLAHAKRVITEGTYKTVNSAPLTRAMNTIKRDLPSGRIRQFADLNIHTAKVNGEVMELLRD